MAAADDALMSRHSGDGEMHSSQPVQEKEPGLYVIILSEREPVPCVPALSERETVPYVPALSEREPVPYVPDYATAAVALVPRTVEEFDEEPADAKATAAHSAHAEATAAQNTHAEAAAVQSAHAEVAAAQNAHAEAAAAQNAHAEAATAKNAYTEAAVSQNADVEVTGQFRRRQSDQSRVSRDVTGSSLNLSLASRDPSIGVERASGIESGYSTQHLHPSRSVSVTSVEKPPRYSTERRSSGTHGDRTNVKEPQAASFAFSADYEARPANEEFGDNDDFCRVYVDLHGRPLQEVPHIRAHSFSVRPVLTEFITSRKGCQMVRDVKDLRCYDLVSKRLLRFGDLVQSDVVIKLT